MHILTTLRCASNYALDVHLKGLKMAYFIHDNGLFIHKDGDFAP